MFEVVAAGVLDVAFEQSGPPGGWPVVLLHGFPYDVRSFDVVAGVLAGEGARVIVPYLRGFGPTRFRRASTMRSGEQAAIGTDVVALLDALGIQQAAVAGFDWGGRAATAAAALWPDRVRYLVCGNGYTIQDIASAHLPADPEDEHRFWYQFYFHGERGRAGLERNRDELCRLLWRLWSPTWHFDEETFERTAVSFENPDFVDVVIHSYRHRYGLAPGDPAYAPAESILSTQPPILVPAITLDGGTDGVDPAQDGSRSANHFRARREHLLIQAAGHNLAQEAPDDFAAAVLRLHHEVG